MKPLLVRELQAPLTIGVVVALIVMSGCALHGPRLTPVSHLAYNEAVQVSEQQELLLNLIRLRYTESPQFLAIGSISSQMRFDARASLAGRFGHELGYETKLLSPEAGVEFSESPTVTFSPMLSEEFTRRLVTPVNLQSLYLLTRYGWSVEKTLQVVAEELNGIRNTLPRETVPAQDVEAIEQFAHLAHLMESLHAQHLLDVDIVEQWAPVSNAIPASDVSAHDLLNAIAKGYRFNYDAGSSSYSLQSRSQHYVLRVAPAARDVPELDELTALLRLRPRELAYEFYAQALPGPTPESTLSIRTRSVLGAMAHVAQGIAVPQDDGDHRFAAASPLPKGIHALVDVRNSRAEPADAFIAVPYRGRWFYIANSDLESRRTLGVLMSLIRLEIGAGTAQNLPVLTLPVGR